MTVADIKEYIDKNLVRYNGKGEGYVTPVENLYKILFEVKSMLDELEPKAKWKHDGSQWENRFICSKCGHKIFEEQQEAKIKKELFGEV